MTTPNNDRYKPCKFMKAVGTWDDDCCNVRSKNFGCYDITGTIKLTEICKSCPDYESEAAE